MTGCLALVAVAADATPASAATTVCNPQTARFEVREAGAGIGDLRFKTNICTKSRKITSSSEVVSWSPSPLGSFTGWNWKNFGTTRLTKGAQTASWSTSGQFTLCVPTQISPLCAFGETYKATFIGYSKDFVGPPTLPNISCSNKYCRQSMTFVYTGRS